MSQLFDSLRRGRESSRSNSRTAQGDVVLATLGYSAPPRRSGRSSAIVVAVLMIGLAAAIWLGWRSYLSDTAGPDAARRAPPPTVPISSPRLSPARIPATESPDTGASSTSADPLISRGPLGSAPRSHPSPRPTPVSASDSSRLPAVRSEPAGPSSSSDNDLELALYYHRAGDFANALQRYRALLARNELNVQAHNNLGLLYQEKGLLQESARELQRAIVIEPRNPGAHNNYGVTLLMQGRTDEAAAEFQSALRIEPANLDALVNLALAERNEGQLDAAKETLLDALNRAPRNAPAHYNLGQLYDQTNEPARAVEHYRLFLENAGAEHSNRAATVRARIAALTRMPE